jgi:uncharacterized protein YjbI with pentapeptide repeats
MCKEMPVIPADRVVDKKRIINKKWRAEEEERHSGLLTKKGKDTFQTNLILTNLVRTNVVWTNIIWTNLVWTNLVRTNLVRTNLVRTNLVWTNLVWTNLVWTNLIRTNFSLPQGTLFSLLSPVLSG